MHLASELPGKMVDAQELKLTFCTIWELVLPFLMPVAQSCL